MPAPRPATPVPPPAVEVPPVDCVPPAPLPPVATTPPVALVDGPPELPLAVVPPEATAPPVAEVLPITIEDPPVSDWVWLVPPTPVFWAPPVANDLELLPLHAMQPAVIASHDRLEFN